jgi:hypothetical protein
MSAITIATASGGLATKQCRQTPAGPILTDYAFEKWWKFREVSVQSNAKGWADFLSERVHDIASCCVYGEPIYPGCGFQRRLLHPADGDPATLREVARAYLLVDLDSVPSPMGLDFNTDPTAAIGSVLDCIEELRCCAFAAAISCSAGFKPGVRAKIVIPLNEPLFPSAMRRWAKAVNARFGTKLLDPAVLAPSQPIYLARPILYDVPDPFPQRVYLRRGREPVAIEIPPEATGTAGLERAAGGGGGWRVHLTQLGLLGFHEPLLAAAGAVVRSYCGAPTEPIASAIHAVVREAVLCADAGARSPHEIARYASRRFWDDALAHAARREGDRTHHIAASVAGIRRT